VRAPRAGAELLIDIKQRGLEIAPDLAVGDGALGFWKAIEEVCTIFTPCSFQSMSNPSLWDEFVLRAIVGANACLFILSRL
jgi:hypothetical protein